MTPSSVYTWFMLLLVFYCQIPEKYFDKALDILYAHSVPLITPHSLDSMIKNGHVYILDTRELEEFEVSHISNSILIGHNHFSLESLRDIPKDKPVVVYCSVSYRSAKIGRELKKNGFKKVFNLYGGIFNWKNKGNKLVNSDGLKTDSVHCYSKEWSRWLKKGVKVY